MRVIATITIVSDGKVRERWSRSSGPKNTSSSITPPMFPFSSEHQSKASDHPGEHYGQTVCPADIEGRLSSTFTGAGCSCSCSTTREAGIHLSTRCAGSCAGSCRRAGRHRRVAFNRALGTTWMVRSAGGSAGVVAVAGFHTLVSVLGAFEIRHR